MAFSQTAEEPQIRAPAHAIVQRWLLSLRWVAFALLAFTLPVGQHLFGFHVRYEIAVPVVVLAAIVNLIASQMLRGKGREKTVSARLIAVFVAFDLVAIGTVLAASGGAANPFSALFLVHVALAAAVLPATLTFALTALATGVFAALFAVPAGSCCAAHARDGSFSAHLYGMWAAFVMCAGLVAFFVTRIRNALDGREREILRLRREADQTSRFAALGTLAAGTAHELGTPLGTIAVLAGELASADLPSNEAQSHARAISASVARCRDVLSKMQAAAHASKGALQPIVVADCVKQTVHEWKAAHPETIVIVDVAQRGARGANARAPIAAEDLTSVLGVLLDNAAFATKKAGSSAPLRVGLTENAGRILVTVEDSGTGVDTTIVDRLGEPFLTTKDPGEGMGLGLYLARGLLSPLGGQLRVTNKLSQIIGPHSPRPGKVESPGERNTTGAIATIDLPFAVGEEAPLLTTADSLLASAAE